MSEAKKHYNQGCVFGRVIEEPKKETSTGGQDYITFKVNCSGPKSGMVTAYCRIWTPERVVPFLQHWRSNPDSPLFLKGLFSQYKDEKNRFMSNFTVFHWDPRETVDPRAVFILRGVVEQAQAWDCGQRLLFSVKREGQNEENFELWCPAESLLDMAEPGQFLEVKGYVRQENPEDEFGGSDGPVRAYVHQLRKL